MKFNRSLNKILKIWVVVLSIVLAVSLAVAGSLAFLNTKTDVVDNQFEEAYVTCRVNRSGDVFDVTNTGNIKAYIRTAIVVNWMDEDGNVRGLGPTDSDVCIQLNTTDWYLSNGYYYYVRPVESNQDTNNLITAITVTGTVPDGYRLSVEVVAEAIQAEGVTGETGKQAIQDAWGGSSGG